MRFGDAVTLGVGCLALAACDMDFGFGPGGVGPDRSEPVRMGMPLLSYASPAAGLSWEADGSGIVFVTRTHEEVAAVEIASGRRSTLGSGPGRGQFESALAAAEEGVAYAVWTDAATNRRSLLRIGTAVADTVMAGVSGRPLHGAGAVRLSGAFRLAFIGAADSLFVEGEVEGVRYVAGGCAGLLGSEAGARAVFCVPRDELAQHLLRIEIAGGSTSHVPVMHHWRNVAAVRSSEGGLAILLRAGRQLVVQEGGAQTSRPISREFPLEATLFHPPAWSSDGSRVAQWLSVCAQTEGWGCRRTQSRLVLLDATRSSSNETVLAVHDGSAPYGPAENLAFSPDGKRVAYVFGESLYVVALE